MSCNLLALRTLASAASAWRSRTFSLYLSALLDDVFHVTSLPDPANINNYLAACPHHQGITKLNVSLEALKVIMASPIMFEDIFEITHLNPEGKKFDLVNRLSALGTTFECDLLLDYNCQIYSLLEGEKMTLVLASTLNLDGSPDDHTSYTPITSMQREATLADSYEYVMHGRVFDVGYKKDGVVQISISFGGLLCRLIGDQRHLTNVVPDMRLYVLIKKD